MKRHSDRNQNALLLILSLAAGLLLLIVVVGGTVAYVAVKQARQDAADARAGLVSGNGSTATELKSDPAAPEASKKVFSKQEFEVAVRGKTRAQIMAALGRPDETIEKVPDVRFYFDWWEYHRRVLNDATGRPYEIIRMRFGGPGGEADLIEYH